LRFITAEKDVYGNLTSYFKQADSRYNSGLFHFREGDGSEETLDRLTLGLKLDNKPLQDIIKHLYPPLCPYEFSYIPADILGQVYERFLGRIIRINGHSIEVDEKPEVKKAGGVYYTPSYVVRHIVGLTVGYLLEGKGPADISGQRPGSKTLRVLDPACGSGSFLIEVYQKLLDWYLERYVEDGADRHARGKSPKIYRGPGGVWRLTIAERKRILTSHIYGVDIDPQAVEVTKLSLLLKVLEGETKDVVASQINFLENQRVLPDLGANVRCGNSLIDQGFYGLFDPSSLTEEQHHKVNVFDWRKNFPTAFRDGGFDAVVGNPPYGAKLLPQEKTYLSSQYPQQSYQLDSYLIFVERSIDLLLRDGGRFGMIIPNPWLTNLLQTRIRNHVLMQTRVDEIVHFTFPVFARARATVDTEIIVFSKGYQKEHKPIAYVVSKISPAGEIDTTTAFRIEHDQDAWTRSAGSPINIFLDRERRQLADKIREAGQPITASLDITVGMKPYQVGKGTPKQTPSDVKGRVFDADSKVGDDCREYLRGADIIRFCVEPVEKRFIRYGSWLAEPRFSAGFDKKVKIVMRQTGDSLVAAIDRERRICMNNMHVLVPKDEDEDVYFFLGLLNSRLMNWYYQSLNPEMGEGLAEVKKTNIERLPIPVGESEPLRKRISDLAQQIEANVTTFRAARDEPTRRVSQRLLDARFGQLNEAVYHLFGLDLSQKRLIELDQTGHSIGEGVASSPAVRAHF
jgi:hypothetical protein